MTMMLLTYSLFQKTSQLICYVRLRDNRFSMSNHFIGNGCNSTQYISSNKHMFIRVFVFVSVVVGGLTCVVFLIARVTSSKVRIIGY